MSLDEYITQVYPIRCKGRNNNGYEVLVEPVYVEVKFSKYPRSNILISTITCPYNTGAHGQRCKASHLGKEKEGEGVYCPYSVDLP